MSKKKWVVVVYTTLIFILIGCVAFVYGYYEAHHISIKKYTFSSKDIPTSFIGKKIVFISDIHYNRFFNQESTRKLVDTINGLKPDIILIGGDLIDKRASDKIPLFLEEIRNLKSTYGVYTVLGNHDHWNKEKYISKYLINCGFNISDNKSYWIKESNDSIKIGGVGDLWLDTQDIDKTIHDVKSANFCILMSHNPDYIDKINTDKVDLMLSGHTHAGQITFFGLWAPVMPGSLHPKWKTTNSEYKYGWMRKNNVELYTSSGVGVGSIPIRFFAPPEIVEITLAK